MPRRIGRPGLVGTMARTAVIAGTATAVSGGMQRRSAGRQADQQAAAAEQQQAIVDQAAAQVAAQQPPTATPQAAPAAAEDPTIARLKELADLKSQGVLDDAEFAAAKAKLLGI